MGRGALLGGLLWALSASSAAARTVVPVAPKGSPASAAGFQYVFSPSERVVVASGDVMVATEKGTSSPPTGYLPLKIQLSNASPKRMPVSILFNPTSRLGRGVSRKLELEPLERRTVVLPIPSEVNYGQLVVSSPGISQGGREHLYFGRVMAPNRAVLALGTAEEFEQVVGLAPTHGSNQTTVLVVPPAEAPDELSAYVGFDAVVVARTPLEELGEGQRRALEAYAATGGVLVLGKVGRGTSSHLPLATPLEEDGGELSRYGFGSLVRCVDEARCSSLTREATTWRTAVVEPKGAPPSWMRRAFATADGARTLLPQALAPVGRFLLIIFAFTLAIGPGSLIIARRRSPAWLLVTIPGTALVTCALIAGYSLLRDGFSVHAATRSLTLLDSRHSRAVTVGVGGFYANLAPGAVGFASTAAVLSPDQRQAEPQPVSIQWAGGPRFGGDFLPARAYREWGLLAVEPSRARLAVRREGGSWRVQNALGARVRSALVRVDGKVFRVEDLREGGEEVARPVAAGAHFTPTGDEHASRFENVTLGWVKRPLEEGEFIAQLDGPGLMPLGGLRLLHDDSAALVRGEVTR